MDKNATTYMLDPVPEPQIEVNWETREVIVPEELYQIGVTGDNNAETVYIKLKNSFDGVSLSDKTPYILFQNSHKEPYKQEISDIQPEGDYLILGWKIDSRFTRYSGKAYFTVSFESTSYTLNSLPGELEIIETLGVGNILETQEENITQQFLRRLSDLEVMVDQINSFNTKVEIGLEDLEFMKTEIEYLKDHAILVN